MHVTVNAADSDGTVTQVQYYDGVPPGAHLLGTLTTAPYSTDLLAQVAGVYTVVAVATDNSGAQTNSSILSFTVNASAGAAQVFYIHTDQLDTPRLITNSNNSAIWRWDSFDAFGDNPPNDDPNLTGLHFIYNPRFAGQYFDQETRLSYNYFRDYDASRGGYPQSDPIGLEGGQFSTYAYAGSSPLMYTDPTGEFAIADDLVFGSALAVGCALSSGCRDGISNALASAANAAGQAIDKVKEACTPGDKDPCDEIRKQIRDLQAQITSRENQLANDQHDLYNRAYSVNPGGDLARKGTYELGLVRISLNVTGHFGVS